MATDDLVIFKLKGLIFPSFLVGICNRRSFRWTRSGSFVFYIIVNCVKEVCLKLDYALALEANKLSDFCVSSGGAFRFACANSASSSLIFACAFVSSFVSARGLAFVFGGDAGGRVLSLLSCASSVRCRELELIGRALG